MRSAPASCRRCSCVGTAYLTTELLGVVIAMAGWSLYLTNRLDALYLGVVERRLTAHGDAGVGRRRLRDRVDRARSRACRSAGSHGDRREAAAEGARASTTRRFSGCGTCDRAIALASSARSRESSARTRWRSRRSCSSWPGTTSSASARTVLERSAASHVGLLTDTLLDPDTDFAIRRRLPRILGTLSDQRALDGLVSGLDDTRFEVRYQCSRAIRRMLAKHPTRSVDSARILAVVERELSVPPQVWHGHRLIDSVEKEDDSVGRAGHRAGTAEPRARVLAALDRAAARAAAASPCTASDRPTRASAASRLNISRACCRPRSGRGCGCCSKAALHRPTPVLTRDLTRNRQPRHGKRDVQPRKARGADAGGAEREHDDGLHDVAEAREERVDRGLGLVLRLARGRQEQAPGAACSGWNSRCCSRGSCPTG